MAVIIEKLCEAKTYNKLPGLVPASSHFVDRDNILDKAAALLAKYDHKWGVCLVHRHCSLDEGEIMLAEGKITEPIIPSNGSITYPERWLSNGKAYEFTTRATETPPHSLFEEFRSLVGNMASVLGLYHVQTMQPNTWQLERTEGRKNIVEIISTKPATSDTFVEAAWAFGDGLRQHSYCAVICHIDWASGDHAGSSHNCYG